MRCLEKNADHRPATAAELVNALNGLQTDGGSAMRSWRVGRIPRIALAAASVAALAIIYSVTRHSGSGADPSMAVLPFSSEGDTADTYFAEGLADELQSSLARVARLRLKSRTMAKAAALKNAGDARATGRALDVTSVLEGSVRRGGGRMRVTISLTSVDDGSVLWNTTMLRDAAEVLTIQNAIKDSIVGALGLTSGPRRNVAGTNDVLAHELYLRGAHLWPSRTRLDEAAKFFEQAIARDSNYAEAYAGLASVWSVIPDYLPINFDTAEARATRAALKAIALDGTLGEPYAALGVQKRRGTCPRALAISKERWPSTPNTATLTFGMRYR
jgi:serine/threonine-protein kinase